MVLWKIKAGYEFRSEELSKRPNTRKFTCQYSPNIQPGHRHGMWHWKVWNSNDKRGRYERKEGIKLPYYQKVKEIDVENGYKYLGILVVDGLRDQEIKEKIQEEWTRWVLKVLKSKLNGVINFTAINSMAVAVIWYSAYMLTLAKIWIKKTGWDKKEIIENKVTEIRKRCGKGLIIMEATVNIEVKSLRKYYWHWRSTAEWGDERGE